MKVDIPAFSQARVLVIGDIMLDRYWQGTTARISPESPVPIVNVKNNQDKPGGAANVAINIASLGGQVSLLGITGRDEAHDSLITQLEALDITCDFDQQEQVKTIIKLRVMSRNQQLLRLDFEDSFQPLDKSYLLKRASELIASHDVLLLSDYNKGTLSVVKELIQLANDNNIPVLVDPKGIDYQRYENATYLTPNTSEFESIVGACSNESDFINKGQNLLNDLNLSGLLVTRSEQGMTLLRKGENEFHLPAQAREVFDVTGAGDTVIATLALALAAGVGIEKAGVLANIAAGIVVGKSGTSSVSEAELMHELHTGHGIGLGCVSQQQLEIVVNLAKSRGEKIVMTNGCFDILHAGHVSYLNNAKQLGERLIVAVNSDESVTRLKGVGRPVNRLERRMAVLAGLSSVDWVVSFSEDTPQSIISDLLPNVLVKGGDYKIEDIAGGNEVLLAGGEVKILNFEEGISTTEIINNIKLTGVN